MSQAPTPAPQAADASANASASKKDSRKKLMAAVAVLALAGGGGFYWKTQQAAAASAHGEEEKEAEDVHVTRGLVSFDPFVVNLADPVPRFLRVSMQLVVKSPEEASALEHSKVSILQARSAILELLTTQTSDVLVTPEGKAGLRAAIVEKVSRDIPGFKVFDVLFSDFVVQF